LELLQTLAQVADEAVNQFLLVVVP